MVSFPKRYQFHQIGTPPPSSQLLHHRLPLFLPYPTSSLRGVFISPLGHSDSFHSFFSYERALHLSTSFPISDLARLGVKPRLCRSSWRAFSSTHPLMLHSTCSREALLACPPFSPWNVPSFTVESTLSTPCSRSDQVYPLKPAPFCTLFAGLGSTNKSAIFLLFSSCLTLFLSSHLKLCGRSGRNCLLSLLLFYQATMGPRTLVSSGERHG